MTWLVDNLSLKHVIMGSIPSPCYDKTYVKRDQTLK